MPLVKLKCRSPGLPPEDDETPKSHSGWYVGEQIPLLQLAIHEGFALVGIDIPVNDIVVDTAPTGRWATENHADTLLYVEGPAISDEQRGAFRSYLIREMLAMWNLDKPDYPSWQTPTSDVEYVVTDSFGVGVDREGEVTASWGAPEDK